MADFAGQSVVVTGAASGIGAATVRRFIADGASVFGVDLNGEGLRAVFAPLPESHSAYLEADTAEKATAVTAVRMVMERFGKLDVLVNNAGATFWGAAPDVTDELWDRALAVNLSGYFYFVRAAMPELIRSKGSVVQVGSVAGLGGTRAGVPHSSTKGGVVNMTRALALDHGPDGVRVNAVDPGLVETGITAKMPDEARTRITSFTPLRRSGQPEEIASVIAFLASSDASFLTGVNVPVDGGVGAAGRTGV